MVDDNSQFQILSLSGGGFRGLFTARILADLEQQTEQITGSRKPIGRCFDLICGTSIGGILALAIGLEKPMAEIAALMEEKGRKIFPRKGKFSGLFSTKHDNRLLVELVDEIFGDCAVNDSRHRLLVPAVNFSTGAPQIFKTSHCESLTDLGYKMRDVALATSAAPGYLPMHKMQKTGTLYVDGGLFGNNPSLFGIYEARYYLGVAEEDIRLLSIGTMGGDHRADTNKGVDVGFWGWKDSLFSLTISSQEKVVNFMAERQLRERYCSIDETPVGVQEKNIGLDVADKPAIETLTSMAEQASRKFLGSDKGKTFLRHTADEFKPLYKQKGESNGSKNT